MDLIELIEIYANGLGKVHSKSDRPIDYKELFRKLHAGNYIGHPSYWPVMDEGWLMPESAKRMFDEHYAAGA